MKTQNTYHEYRTTVRKLISISQMAIISLVLYAPFVMGAETESTASIESNITQHKTIKVEGRIFFIVKPVELMHQQLFCFTAFLLHHICIEI